MKDTKSRLFEMMTRVNKNFTLKEMYETNVHDSDYLKSTEFQNKLYTELVNNSTNVKIAYDNYDTDIRVDNIDKFGTDEGYVEIDFKITIANTPEFKIRLVLDNVEYQSTGEYNMNPEKNTASGDWDFDGVTAFILDNDTDEEISFNMPNPQSLLKNRQLNNVINQVLRNIYY